MTNKDLYREKEVRGGERGSRWKVDKLAQEIAKVRKELDRKIAGNHKILTSDEILELSQRLDKLIVSYLENS